MQEDKNKTNFSDIGKEIAIERLFEGSGYSNSGDFTLKNGQTLHKVMLEGVDFDLIYTPLKHLGYKAALSIIGDAYANMTTPKHLSIVLGISAKFYFEDISDLWCGFLACAKEFEIEDVTLDLMLPNAAWRPAPMVPWICLWKSRPLHLRAKPAA